ncbi:MAG: hypothetical protein WDO12_05130 [Pseudomonadota bacterium]
MLALATLGSAAAADQQWRFPTDEITLKQWQEFRAEVLAKPGIERQEFANQLVLTSKKEFKIYVFTQPTHPAYPAVVIRAIVARGAGSEVRRMGHYAGDKKAFEKWWHEFDALDARIPGQIR